MSSPSRLPRALLVAFASLALCAPAAVARPADLRYEAPTSSLSGSTDQTEAGPRRVLRQAFDPRAKPRFPFDAARAQERTYSTYGEPTPPREKASTAATDSGDGIAWVPFVLGLVAALAVGLGAGSGLRARRHTTRPAT